MSIQLYGYVLKHVIYVYDLCNRDYFGVSNEVPVEHCNKRIDKKSTKLGVDPNSVSKNNSLIVVYDTWPF